jgi:RIO kinase 1
MHDFLAPLLADGIIDEVLGRLKSGKEADLWLVRHGGEIVAAKVYKPRLTRSFKNDAAYREGRQVRNTRTQRAMDRGTRFGQAAAEEAWKSKEADALYALHAAGVRVPEPVLFHEGVLLMEVVVDGTGSPAPRLVDAYVPREQAAALYADLRLQAVRMLTCDFIHGDLSPFNVLMGSQGPVVIDFPQVIGAAHNSQAERFFERDLENIRRHFAALDPSLHASSGDGREIWRAYARRELTPDFVPSGKRPQHARQEHARQEHARQEHARQEHARQEHARQEHARQEHARQEHARQGQHPQEQQHRQERHKLLPQAAPRPQSAGSPLPSRPPTSPERPSPSAQRPPPRRPPDRTRRGPPMPEVVRVARLAGHPPVTPPNPAPQAPPQLQGATTGTPPSPSRNARQGPPDRHLDGRFGRRSSS